MDPNPCDPDRVHAELAAFGLELAKPDAAFIAEQVGPVLLAFRNTTRLLSATDDIFTFFQIMTSHAR